MNYAICMYLVFSDTGTMLPRNRHLKKMVSAFIIACSTSSCNINPGKCFSTPRCTTTSPPSQWSWTRPAKAAAWPPQTAGIDLISGDVGNWGPWIYYFFSIVLEKSPPLYFILRPYSRVWCHALLRIVPWRLLQLKLWNCGWWRFLELSWKIFYSGPWKMEIWS